MINQQFNSYPRCVLVVAAHPDDIEFMAGGTIAHWAAAGATVHYLLVTDGAGGSRDPNQTPERLTIIRRAEQHSAAAILGVRSVTFLGYPDGWVEPTLALRLDIARIIRRVRPDVIVTQDPYFRYNSTYINHPDHRAVAEATLAAIMPAANTRLSALQLLEEDLEPHDVSEVYLTVPLTPTVWVPLTVDELDCKLGAIRAHASQFADNTTEQIAYEWALQAAAIAREHGINCEFAEAFAYVQLCTHENHARETRKWATTIPPRYQEGWIPWQN